MGKRVRKGWALVLTLALVMALARGGGPVMAEDMEEATEAQIEAATEAVTESQTNAATEAVTEGQTSEPTEAVTEGQTSAATEAVTESQTNAATEAVTEGQTNAATEAVTESQTNAATEAVTESQTNAATEATTEGQTNAATEATTEGQTNAATEAVTEGQTNAATEGQSEETTEGQTNAATEGQSEETTEGQTNAATEGQSEETTEGQTNAVTEGQSEETTEGQTDAATEEQSESETDTDAETESESETETETESVVENIVTFDVAQGAVVTVDDVDVKEETPKAQNGKIVFTAKAEAGYEITSILVDGITEARKNEETPEADDYIIEGITEDDTIVTVKTEEVEHEVTDSQEVNGTIVEVWYSSKAFEGPVTLRVTELSRTETPIAAEESQSGEAEVQYQISHDVSFVNQNGEEVEPKEGYPVEVSIRYTFVEQEVTQMEVVHVPDAGEQEVVADEPQESRAEANFTLDSFSVITSTITALGAATLADMGSETIAVGETITLTGTNGSNHSWKSSNSSVAAVSPNGDSATVTGVSEGRVTITHSYYSGWRQYSDTWTVIVTASGTASYTLYCYTLIPGKTVNSSGNADSIWNGMGTGTISNVNAPSSYDIGTIIDDGYESSGAKITYPSSYPPIEVDGTVYQYAERNSENAYKEGYYTIEWIRVIDSDGANAGNNNWNPTVNSGTKTYHLDGQITLNEKNIYTVTFKIQEPGAQSFTIQEKYSRRVESGFAESDLTRPAAADKTVDGIEYEFDGWYLDEACTQKADFTGTITQNTTYYGKYVPKNVKITVYKVTDTSGTGNMTDANGTFQFHYSTDSNESGSFTVTAGSSQVISVKRGSTVTISETNAASDGYTVTVQYGETSQEGASYTIEKVTKDTSITFTNKKIVAPPTGLADNLTAYGAMLLTALAGMLLWVTCRRKRDLN